MKLSKHLKHINPYAADIDVGAKSRFVAVPEGADEKPVREFPNFYSAERSFGWLGCHRRLSKDHRG